MKKYQIAWTEQAKSSLKNIFNYYKDKSLQGAKNVRKDTLESTKTIYIIDIISTKQSPQVIKNT